MGGQGGWSVRLVSLALVAMAFSAWSDDLRGVDANGLVKGFYSRTCRSAEALVRKAVVNGVSGNKALGGALLRLHFHDCFVEGCDGSVLIDSTPSNAAEKEARSNANSLRGFEIIDAAKSAVEAACPGVVSCADIVAFAARDSVNFLGGPWYPVPAGRRDGSVSSAAAADSALPLLINSVSELIQNFANVGLNSDDLVVLSGAHTIGQGRCVTFRNRLSPLDPTLNASYAQQLAPQCPDGFPNNRVPLDPTTPDKFDNAYYTDLELSEGLFPSDQGLILDDRTKPAVLANANNERLFFAKFVRSMTKMGAIGVKTGINGQIRLNCHVVNS